MIEFFRKNFFINVLLILPYIILVRIGTLVHPDKSYVPYDGSNVLLQWIYDVFSSPLSQSIASIIIIFAHATYLNHISIKNRLSREITLFAGIAYVVLVSLSPSIAGFTPALMANTFMILALANIYNSYKSPYPSVHNFNAGFFLTLALIFYPPYSLFLLFGFVSLMILTSFRWKAKLQYVSGCGVSLYLFYAFAYSFSEDTYATFLDYMSNFGFINFRAVNTLELIVLLFYALIFLITFFSYNKYGLKKSIQVQKKIDTLYWIMLFAGLSITFSEHVDISHLVSLAIPMSLLLGLNMSTTKNKMMLELIHILCLGLIATSFFFLKFM